MADDEALRKLLQAKIACSNSVEAFETLNSLTDDWDESKPHLEAAALEIHLQCEAGAKEATAIHDSLIGILSSGPTNGWLWTEMELRQENGATAVKEVMAIINQLSSSSTGDPDISQLGLKEMKLRAKHILAKLEGLKSGFQELKAHVLASLTQMLQQQQRQEHHLA